MLCRGFLFVRLGIFMCHFNCQWEYTFAGTARKRVLPHHRPMLVSTCTEYWKTLHHLFLSMSSCVKLGCVTPPLLESTRLPFLGCRPAILLQAVRSLRYSMIFPTKHTSNNLINPTTSKDRNSTQHANNTHTHRTTQQSEVLCVGCVLTVLFVCCCACSACCVLHVVCASVS